MPKILQAAPDVQIQPVPRLSGAIIAALKRLDPQAAQDATKFNADFMLWRSNFQAELARRIGTIEARLQQLEGK